MNNFLYEKDPIVVVIEDDKAVITTAAAAKKKNQKPYEFLKLIDEPQPDAPKTESKDAPADAK